MFDYNLLIDLVKARPALYNSISGSYRRNRTALNELWVEIAEIMEKDVQECRTVWTSVRSSYARHLQNQKKHKDDPRRKYKCWYLANKLEFLDEHMQLNPNERQLYCKPKNPNSSTSSINADDDSTTFFNFEYSRESEMDGSQSIGSIKPQGKLLSENHYKETNNLMKTPELFEETTHNEKSSMKEFENEIDSTDNFYTTQWNKRKNVYPSLQVSKRIKTNPSESNLNVQEKRIQSREGSISIFFQSMLFDISKLSDRRLRLFKQDVLINLNKYLDDEETDD